MGGRWRNLVRVVIVYRVEPIDIALRELCFGYQKKQMFFDESNKLNWPHNQLLQKHNGTINLLSQRFLTVVTRHCSDLR